MWRELDPRRISTRMTRGRHLLPPLPESFLFGVGNSAHQCEAFDPSFKKNIRDVWDETPGSTPRGQATDFWNRYRKDICLAQAIGCKAFRFSIDWARVEPSPGVYNDAAFDHYRDVIATIRDAGLEPVLTLHHFTWPIHVEERGGHTDRSFPDIFASYADEVAQRLGQDVRYWITFNEPNLLTLGYIKPWWESDYFFPPGMREEAAFDDQIGAVSRLIPNLFRAHKAARAAIRARHPEAQVSANPALLGLPVWLQRLMNRHTKRLQDLDKLVRNERRFVERALLEQGSVDMVIANVTVTSERAQHVDFSEVYYVAGQTLLVEAKRAIAAPADLRGRAVAVVRSSTAEGSIHTLFPEAKVRIVADHAAALKSLDTGQVVAILSDDTILLGIIQQHPGRYRLIGGRLTDELYAVAVTKGNPELLNAVNNAVRQFKESGEWAASYERHFPGKSLPTMPQVAQRTSISDLRQMGPGPHDTPVQQPSHTETSLASRNTLLQRIQGRGHLIVAVKEDVPGFGYRDRQTGKWSGLEIDLARAVARHIFGDPDRVVFQPVTTRQRFPRLHSFQRLIAPLLKLWGTLSSLFNVNWWHLGMAGELPKFLCPLECVGEHDFVGFDYYWGIRSFQLDRILRLTAALTTGDYENAPVWPGALYGNLKFLAKLFPDMGIMIVENGSVDVADGLRRQDYIRLHIREVQRAVRDGINVIGYLYWSITTNWEWGHKPSPGNDFGLYHIDLTSDPELKRTPTDAATVYKKIMEESKGFAAADEVA